MARINQVLSFTQPTPTTLQWSLGAQATVLDISRLSGAVMTRAAIHGLKQRCGDKAALGQEASAQAKFDAVRAMVDHYNSGTEEWNLSRQGGGRKSEADWVTEAIAALYEEELSDAEARIVMWAESKECDVPTMCKALAKSAKVAVKIAELKHGDGSGVDADELLGDI